jgi:hypothetical protein
MWRIPPFVLQRCKNLSYLKQEAGWSSLQWNPVSPEITRGVQQYEAAWMTILVLIHVPSMGGPGGEGGRGDHSRKQRSPVASRLFVYDRYAIQVALRVLRCLLPEWSYLADYFF